MLIAQNTNKKIPICNICIIPSKRGEHFWKMSILGYSVVFTRTKFNRRSVDVLEKSLYLYMFSSVARMIQMHVLYTTKAE